MPDADARTRFIRLVHEAVQAGTLVKLTLGKARAADPTLRNLFVRPVSLKAGPHLAFLWRHDTRDVTKNHPAVDALPLLEAALGREFLDGHLFTSTQVTQFESRPGAAPRLTTKPAPPAASPATAAPCPIPGPRPHDRAKAHAVPPDAPWLRDLGVTNEHGQPRAGLTPKFRQIQKFAELLSHLLPEARLAPAPDRPLHVVDMGCGKGYLTFATAALLGPGAVVQGVELRPALVDEANRIARVHAFANLTFRAGDIASTPLGRADVLIALHACDTATDDALARGLAAGARLLVVSPCCQQELRPQLTPPPVLAPALRHGIFQERHTEFVTDALRALVLEAAGCKTKVIEFISPDHTARNLMLVAVRPAPGSAAPPTLAPAAVQRARDFAAFYGIRTQALARQLGLDLVASPTSASC